jgi:hypothetical protein
VSDELEAWRSRPSDAAFERVQKGFREVWAEMDRASASPNPTFERQAKVYRAEGIRVVPVPIFPTGEGGLHCLGLAWRSEEPSESGVRVAALSGPGR